MLLPYHVAIGSLQTIKDGLCSKYIFIFIKIDPFERQGAFVSAASENILCCRLTLPGGRFQNWPSGMLSILHQMSRPAPTTRTAKSENPIKGKLSDVSHTQCTAAGFLNLRSKVRWPGPAQLILMIGLRFPPQTCGKIKVGVASCKLEYFPSSSNRFRSDDFAERPFLHGFSARVRKDHSWFLLKILLI